MEEQDKLTEPIIGAAIEVHRILGPGLLERQPATGLKRALLLNFGAARLVDGSKRLSL